MKLIYLLSVLFPLFLMEIASAQNVITFDDQGWTSDQSLDSNFTTGNFLFSSNKNFYTNYGCNLDVYNVSLYFVFQNPAVDQFTINSITNEPLNLISLAAYQVSESSTDTLIIEGWNGSVKEYTSSFANLNTWQVLNLNYEDVNKIIFKLKSSGYNGISDFNFDNFSFNDNVVPVELTEFKAAVEENYIKLEWQTATELNNYGFDIERKSSETIWQKVGFVNGNSNSTIPKSYNFIDNSVQDAFKYKYRLKQIDNNGNFIYSKEIEIIFNTPQNWILNQNYPNPFNPTTNISYQIAEPSMIILKIYDILGNEVFTYSNEFKKAGSYSVIFNAENLSSGIYIYKLVTNKFVSTKKMILMK